MTLRLKSLRNKHISITIKKATSDSRFFYELLVNWSFVIGKLVNSTIDQCPLTIDCLTPSSTPRLDWFC